MINMRYFILALFLLISAVQIPLQSKASEMGIAVVVNEDAISMADLSDRYRLILVSSRIPDGAEARARITPQIVSSLIEEQLKFQEGARNEVEVSQSEINNGFATIAQQNGLEPDQFRKALQQSGINLETMYRQIRSQIMWSKVVAKRLRPQVNISESDLSLIHI